MKKLDLVFRSATKNTVHHMQLNHVKAELGEEDLRKYMGQIAALAIFNDKTGDATYAPQFLQVMLIQKKRLFLLKNS